MNFDTVRSIKIRTHSFETPGTESEIPKEKFGPRKKYAFLTETNLNLKLASTFRSLYVRKLVEDLREEIREHGTFEVLTKEVEETIARKKEEEALRSEGERLEKLVEELQETIANEKIAHEEERRRILNEISTEQVYLTDRRGCGGRRNF